MRVAIAAWSVRQAGGVEAYVAQVSGALANRGHDISLWYETDEPRSRPRLDLSSPVQAVAFTADAQKAGDQLREWRPDVVLLNEMESPARETALAEAFPAVLVAHNYHGTCISGTKTWNRPHVQPCTRAFGPGCLVAYFPRQCGGRSPFTMFSLYAVSSKRLAAARRCAAILTLSDHMRTEFVRHGIPAERVVTVPYGPPPFRETAPVLRSAHVPLRLAVVARLEHVKGVHLAIQAAADLVNRLDRPVTLTVIGEGREKDSLAQLATEHCQRTNRLQIEFSGWLPPEARDSILVDSDLLLVPSVWSEPFGLVGLEAGRLGLPAVAFDIGGVRQWLDDGVNGRLAAPDPPTALNLARAAADCLSDEARYAAMRAAAFRLSSRFTLETHVDGLLSVINHVLASSPMASACASA